jgi:hypothetical protein
MVALGNFGPFDDGWILCPEHFLKHRWAVHLLHSFTVQRTFKIKKQKRWTKNLISSIIFSTHLSTKQCQLPQVQYENLDNQLTDKNPMKEHNMAKKGARTKTPKASLKHVQYREPLTETLFFSRYNLLNLRS